MPMADVKYYTPEEIAGFEGDGLVVARGLYDAPAMRGIAAWADDIQARPGQGYYTKER